MSNELQKWADVAMFKADPIDVESGSQVTLLSCNSDPLGTIAAAALMYEGKSVNSLAEITDEQRRHYLDDVRKSALAAPLEFVNFHFLISGVTRGFTHQMVRQRTATYTQESTRFAVKEEVPVGRPPSLDGTVPWDDWVAKCWKDLYPNGGGQLGEITAYAMKHASPEQMWRYKWDYAVGQVEVVYKDLVNQGMPAEDARGLLPTNLLTRINYNTSLRGLLEHSGLRLCTQAQFEWRLVWARIKEAIVEYGKRQTYNLNTRVEGRIDNIETKFSTWQFEELATIFKPICYQKGSCQFNADVDRACSIKSRVEANAIYNRPSSEWHKSLNDHQKDPTSVATIPAIKDEEWMLDPSAARVSQ